MKLEQKRESELPNWVKLDHHSQLPGHFVYSQPRDGLRALSEPGGHRAAALSILALGHRPSKEWEQDSFTLSTHSTVMLDGRSSWHGGVGWGGDGARLGARRCPVLAWWAGAGGQSSDDSHGTL